MAEDQDDTKDQKDQDQTDDQDQKDQDQDDQKDQDQKKDVDPELAKAQKRRDSALARAQKAEEEARALREKYEKSDEDPVVKANRRLVAAEGRVVLTAAGITKDDQATVLKYLDLDSVSVGDDGQVDSDTLQERVEELARIFGGRKDPAKRTPKVDTRDRGGERAKPEDAATARRKAMLGGR